LKNKMKTFREKTFNEQKEEAEKHTTLDEAMAKPYFAQTAYDHLVRCGTPPDSRMMEEPTKPYVDFLTDEEIEERIDHFYKGLNPNNPYACKFFEEDIVREIQEDCPLEKKVGLAHMVLFLSSVGRLPEKYEHLIRGNEK